MSIKDVNFKIKVGVDGQGKVSVLKSDVEDLGKAFSLAQSGAGEELVVRVLLSPFANSPVLHLLTSFLFHLSIIKTFVIEIPVAKKEKYYPTSHHGTSRPKKITKKPTEETNSKDDTRNDKYPPR